MKKSLSLILTLLFVLLLLASCGSSAPLDKSENGGYGAEMAPEGEYGDGALADKDLTISEGSGAQNQKLITTVYMTVESKEYDTLVNTLMEKVKASGGYIENSKVSASSQNALRRATLILRVPADKLDTLTDAVKAGATVTSYEESSVDVSLTYADLEGRLTSLRAEQTALNAMLEKANSVSTAIEIQKRLTEVRGEIESIESQLRVLDSKISYSTLTLNVREVEKETVPKDETNLFEEIGEEFMANAKDTGEYLGDLLVFIIGGLPILVSVLATLLVIFGPPALVVLIIVLIIRSTIKKKKKNAEKAAAQKD